MGLDPASTAGLGLGCGLREAWNPFMPGLQTDLELDHAMPGHTSQV